MGNPLANTPSVPAPRITSGREPLQRPLVAENATRTANRPVPPISGPSMLGLNQPGPNQSGPNQPSLDSLRDKAFSGLDSFFEPEQPKTGGRRILLMVVLLAALGGASWWTYTNYIGPAESRKPSGQGASTGASTNDAGSSQAAVPSASVPEGPSENATSAADSSRKAAKTEPKPTPEEKPATPVTRPAPRAPVSTVTATKIAPAQKIAANRDPGITAHKAATLTAPAAADTGEADFRKGEAYLYGRGAAENCDEAVKYLKAASAKSNAKARSAFGTMYATGHCAPRDLPTSYLWFALALKVDPNNQILEKDLSAVWNQMTPPERQMATRMKQ